jgi:hypothetical protein
VRQNRRSRAKLLEPLAAACEHRWRWDQAAGMAASPEELYGEPLGGNAAGAWVTPERYSTGE